MTPGGHSLGLTLAIAATGLATRVVATVLPNGSIDVAAALGFGVYVFLVFSLGYGLAALLSNRRTH